MRTGLLPYPRLGKFAESSSSTSAQPSVLEEGVEVTTVTVGSGSVLFTVVSDNLLLGDKWINGCRYV